MGYAGYAPGHKVVERTPLQGEERVQYPSPSFFLRLTKTKIVRFVFFFFFVVFSFSQHLPPRSSLCLAASLARRAPEADQRRQEPRGHGEAHAQYGAGPRGGEVPPGG